MFRKFRHRYLEPAAASLLIAAGKYCPRFIARFAALIGGFAAAPFLARKGSRMDVNIRNVAVPLGLKVTSRKLAGNMMLGFMDFLRSSRLSDEKFRELVQVRGAEHLTGALREGKGVIAITAHYSAWELIPRAVSLLGASVGVVGRKLWNPRVSSALDRLRAEPGIALVDRGAPATGLIRLLRKNTAVGILIDQDTITVESSFQPFLGLAARTPVGPAGIAIRYGVPILTLHIASRGKSGYLLTIDPVFDTDDFTGANGIELLTAELNRRIGEWIIDDPDQWIWFHKRWDRRPPGSSGLR
ncbi:hypothetical protein CSA37_13315 [Candidatus Fermentibacteria bacterium]|nr:MAG: hypothetical protein CSA37_13315 [Candidatus Fermentibacteria bacterium]